ncbi:MoaD/ThiS family protein [Pontibacter qinzhouensis]|uniref:MoaD/ThiS family protein n=1 Tax=Pontibacter qinzhouensis TaxID=2603253 RepID=A0A5C8KAG5_9BACT|nr:MoaD/ThiS family protein [Pontibacter qinzhouensis]TXK48731.1 MoaD/ThiS family protein [Pontibacter qinzhouensis]
MKVQVFAALKDYFDKEFEVAGNVQDVKALKQHLLELNGAAGNMLKICRFAVGDEFVDPSFQLKENDTVCVIPPSSGG